MPNEQQPQPTGMFESLRNSAYWLAFLLQTLAVSVEVIIRRRMGSRAVDLRGFAAFCLIPVWTLFFPHESPAPLLWFWLLFIAGCAKQRLSSLRGDLGHSRYSGEPILGRFFPKHREIAVKQTAEPLLVMIVGVFCLPLSEGLGSYLIAAGFALGASVGLNEAADRAKMRELNDARLEQEQLVDRFRRERGEL